MGGRGNLQNKIFYFFVDKKHIEKAKRTGNTGNFILIGAWQP